MLDRSTRTKLAVPLALTLLWAAAVPGTGSAQQSTDPSPNAEALSPEEAAAVRGNEALERILARQRGEAAAEGEPLDIKGSAAQADALSSQLGANSVNDADLFRQIRQGSGDISVSTNDPVDAVLVQEGGMRWLEWRKGPVATYGGLLLLGVIALLAVFYFVRGRITIDRGRSGIKIERFNGFERFGHWLLGGSFIVLGLTGLALLFGRSLLIPVIGHEAFSPIAIWGKWLHNNLSWAFMLALVWVFVAWVANNIPDKTDWKWVKAGGGMFTKNSHPAARKFNAGQKVLFWAVIILGASISASGLSLLFPFELPMFAKTFEVINGAVGLVGIDPVLPVALQPHEEMQYAQIWHTVVSFAMMAIVLAHIYIGSIGMEGAFDAMGSGEVDLNWAREHHSLWVEEMAGHPEDDRVRPGGRPGSGAVPAE